MTRALLAVSAFALAAQIGTLSVLARLGNQWGEIARSERLAKEHAYRRLWAYESIFSSPHVAREVTDIYAYNSALLARVKLGGTFYLGAGNRLECVRIDMAPMSALNQWGQGL